MQFFWVSSTLDSCQKKCKECVAGVCSQVDYFLKGAFLFAYTDSYVTYGIHGQKHIDGFLGLWSGTSLLQQIEGKVGGRDREEQRERENMRYFVHVCYIFSSL